MVKRVTRWLKDIRAHLDKAQESLNCAVELFGNLEALAQEEFLLHKLGHDITLLREVLEAVDPAALHDAWLGLSDEKRAEIINAAADAEAEIILDSNADDIIYRAFTMADDKVLAAIVARLSDEERAKIKRALNEAR